MFLNYSKWRLPCDMEVHFTAIPVALHTSPSVWFTRTPIFFTNITNLKEIASAINTVLSTKCKIQTYCSFLKNISNNSTHFKFFFCKINFSFYFILIVQCSNEGFSLFLNGWSNLKVFTLLNRSCGTFFNTMGSIVCTFANQASGINNAQTTWHQATKEGEKVNIYSNLIISWNLSKITFLILLSSINCLKFICIRN